MAISVKKYSVLLLLCLSLSTCMFSQNRENTAKQTVLMATQEEDDSIPAVPVLTIGHRTSADSIHMRKLSESYRAEEAAEEEREKEAWIKKASSPEQLRSAMFQKEIDRQAPMLVEPVDPVLPIDPEPTDTLLQHLNPVGEIPMTSNVALSGAFTMTVPIDCYSGIGDAQPHISLVYNSQQGNGIIGMGWGLNGISKINVSYKNIYYDGSAGMPSSGLNGTTSDVYTLDGSRLIRSGSNYVTVSGNVKVAPVPQTRMVGGPDFCSYSPDGSVYMYAQTGIKEYSIISFRDKNGNEVTYTYTNDSPVKLLSKITYAGGKASIEFVYSTTRSDPMTRYFNGYKYSETKRLESIKYKLNGAVIRNYILSYFAAGGLGSLAGSSFMMYGGKFASSTAGTYAFSGLAGGVGAELTGGNFWEGAAVGVMNAGLNHLQSVVGEAGARYYANKKAGYGDMWNNSFVDGKATREVFAWELENGDMIMLPYDKNGLTTSYNDALKVVKIDGERYVQFNGKNYALATHAHTHPSMAGPNAHPIGLSQADLNMQKFIGRPINILYNKGIYSVNGTYNYKAKVWNYKYTGTW